MRVKKPYIVITFDSRTELYEAQSLCVLRGIQGRIIPIPPSVSAGCGLCWRMEPSEFEAHKEELLQMAQKPGQVHTVMLYSVENTPSDASNDNSEGVSRAERKTCHFEEGGRKERITGNPEADGLLKNKTGHLEKGGQ